MRRLAHRHGMLTVRNAFFFVALLILAFVIWQLTMPVPTDRDWKDQLSRLSTADFQGDYVTVKNIRNFQYDSKFDPTVENYYDKTFDLRQIKKVWYIVVPFHSGSVFAHTFVSFEFNNGTFLAITIEGRLTKEQTYSVLGGLLHTYPLMYVAADERDTVYERTNIYKDDVFAYPVRADPAQARLLLVDMLERMNHLAAHPEWYNSVFANCTTNIADHVNKIWPGILPRFIWQTRFTSFADELALSKGLLDTDLSLADARKKFNISQKALKVGYVPDFSVRIREGEE